MQLLELFPTIVDLWLVSNYRSDHFRLRGNRRSRPSLCLDRPQRFQHELRLCAPIDTQSPFTLSHNLVFRLIHLHPALTMAMAFLARRCEARMGLALAVHVKGF